MASDTYKPPSRAFEWCTYHDAYVLGGPLCLRAEYELAQFANTEKRCVVVAGQILIPTELIGQEEL